MAKQQSTEVVKKEAGALSPEFAGLEAYAGQGLDDLDQSDRSIPFIKVLEKNSPEIETVSGAKPGMFINTATQQLYESIRFVPACRDHKYVEWVPIDNGGGLVASYNANEPIAVWAAKQRGKIKLKNNNDLVETFYLFGIVLPEEGDEDADPMPAVIAFTSTRIKAYKSIVNVSDSILLRGANGRKFKAPWFCHVWRITSEKKVDGNQSWYVYKAELDGEDAAAARLPADHPAVLLGAAMVEQKNAGDLIVNPEAIAGDQPDVGSRASGDKGGKNRVMTDEELGEPPF